MRIDHKKGQMAWAKLSQGFVSSLPRTKCQISAFFDGGLARRDFVAKK